MQTKEQTATDETPAPPRVVRELTAELAGRLIEAVASSGASRNLGTTQAEEGVCFTCTFDVAAGLGVEPVDFNAWLSSGEHELDRLAADPTAAPRQDLGPAVALAAGVRAFAKRWFPVILQDLIDEGEAGDLRSRDLVERFAGAADGNGGG